ncbi:hypothetical protein SAMN05421770_104383 [Granulicella rosea]|uniref:Lysylphosphatidylglycerol synthase TM region n=1 Tax=Granulicella rosea TaxID=474952 RepID=A0A239K9M7_9BACT|nr:lysylphosphatidylglycerol synthase transmembrane domain-containing protein [Granulicella rosea]SNT14670.1 hypothetical protein SAMN05421770_104383 [Granulicella rosea]
MSKTRGRDLLKIIPGLLISGFFLWFTFHKISFAEIRELHFASPLWIVGVVGFTFASYSLRCVRWAAMMRGARASLKTCARVLLVSQAANNILPLRIGDVMRCFTYADDLGASPSVILSTVILEKLLDIFILVLLFVAFMGPGVSAHSRVLAETMLGVSATGLLVLLLGAPRLEGPVRALFQRLPQTGLFAKAEHWLLLAIDCLRQIGVPGSLLLLVQSAVIWACEGMIYVSGAKALGFVTDSIGAWQAVSIANLSYLIPSSPGAIGTFEWAVRAAYVSHGAEPAQAAVFGIALHAWLLVSVTGVGGVVFLAHRIATHNRKPLLGEIESLPPELP